MMTKIDKSYIGLLFFGEKGIDVCYGTDSAFITNQELILMGHHYSLAIGRSQEKQGLYGPFPVSYKPAWLVYAYSFSIIDQRIKNPRIAVAGGRTNAFILLFFPIRWERQWISLRKYIEETLEKFSKHYTKITDIKKEDLIEGNEIIFQYVLKKIEGEITAEPISQLKLIETNIAFAAAIGNTIGKRFKIAIYDNKGVIADILRKAFTLVDLEIFLKIEKRKDRNELIFEGNAIYIIIKDVKGGNIAMTDSDCDAAIYYDHPLNPHFIDNTQHLIKQSPIKTLITLIMENPDNIKIDLSKLGLTDVLTLRSTFFVNTASKSIYDALIEVFERMFERI